MAHHFRTSASFTVPFTLVKGSIHVLLGISVKMKDGVVPEARLKCPGGCTEDSDALWSRLGETILPGPLQAEVFLPGAEKGALETAVCNRLLLLGIPLNEITPRSMSESILSTAVAHREFFAETGNKLPDVTSLIKMCDFTTPIARGKRLQGWQYAIIEHSLFNIKADRDEAAEMLPFEWYPLQKVLSGFVDGVKIIPMHWSAIAKSADLACKTLKETANFNRASAELFKAFGESLAWGLNGRANGKALGEEIDQRLADREPGF